MSLTRYFYVSEDLDDLEALEQELEAAGVRPPQIHVLTLDDSGAHRHVDLHEVTSLMKKDVLRSGLIGAALGAVGAALVVLAGVLSGGYASTAGSMAWSFLAVIVFGFCTWEGGLLGIQRPNALYRRFESAMEQGRHVFFVDVDAAQGRALDAAVARHPRLQAAGRGPGAPAWFVAGRHGLHRLLFETLP